MLRYISLSGWQKAMASMRHKRLTSFLGRNSRQFPNSEIKPVTASTKLGSVPYWIQSPDEAPSGWNFIGQLDSTYSFFTPPSTQSLDITADPELWEGRSHCCEGPNFGDRGIGYIFLRNTATTPEGWFVWQCG